MATTESTYLMRDQLQSETLRAQALEVGLPLLKGLLSL